MTVPLPDMDDLVRVLTRACREADKTFERVGGSTRHWVRDCFLPALAKHHLTLSDGDWVTSCQHCGDDIKPRDWMDRETHTTCATGSNRDKPHAPNARSIEVADAGSSTPEKRD